MAGSVQVSANGQPIVMLADHQTCLLYTSGEFSLGHAGFVSVGAYVSASVSGALAGKGLSDLGLVLIALRVGGLAAGLSLIHI